MTKGGKVDYFLMACRRVCSLDVIYVAKDTIEMSKFINVIGALDSPRIREV